MLVHHLEEGADVWPRVGFAELDPAQVACLVTCAACVRRNIALLRTPTDRTDDVERRRRLAAWESRLAVLSAPASPVRTPEARRVPIVARA